MTGIEKITQRIAGDAAQETAAVLEQAQTQAQEIRQRYQAEAEQRAGEIKARDARQAQERRGQLVRMAELERRQQLLAAKQEVLAQAFALAEDKLRAMPEREYVELLTQLVVKASSSGQEQLIFCPADRARYGVKVATQANALLEKAGRPARLTLAQQSREFRGGVVLADGRVEVNCTIESLVRQVRQETSLEAAKILFGTV